MWSKEFILISVVVLWLFFGFMIGRRRGMPAIGALSGLLGPIGVGLLRLRQRTNGEVSSIDQGQGD
jgi:hypothetical protein